MKKITDTLLGALYDCYFQSDRFSMSLFAEETGWDPLDLRKTAHSLEGQGYLTDKGSGIEITGNGVLHCERSGIRVESLEEYNQLRELIIEFLDHIYVERGPKSGAILDHIAQEVDADRAAVARQLRLLTSLDYVNSQKSLHYLTQRGLVLAQREKSEIPVGERSAAPMNAREVWQDKLSFLLKERAITADSETKFSLNQRIKEAQDMLSRSDEER